VPSEEAENEMESWNPPVGIGDGTSQETDLNSPEPASIKEPAARYDRVCDRAEKSENDLLGLQRHYTKQTRVTIDKSFFV